MINGKHDKETMVKELTMILMYLTRFHDLDRLSIPEPFYAWKGYDFAALNDLDDADYIRQGSHPSKGRKAMLTEAGMEYARSLMKKYGIEVEDT